MTGGLWLAAHPENKQDIDKMYLHTDLKKVSDYITKPFNMDVMKNSW